MELAEMDSQVTFGDQLKILYEQGAALSLEFGTEQQELYKQQKKQEQREPERDERGWLKEPEDLEEKEKAPKQAGKDIGFEGRYQRWYSIALPLMQKLAPDRCAEFRAYYHPDPKRESIDGYNYVIQDWIRFQAPDEETDVAAWAAALRCFLNQLTILKSIKDRLEWQALVSEDQSERVLQLEELEAARGLIQVSERAAGALAGAVLEAWLLKLAAKRQVPLRKQRPPVRELADALKAAKVFDAAVWSQATWLAEIRQRCLEAKGEAPTKLQVRDLVDGTQWLITNVF
jgi:hypothetical protein